MSEATAPTPATKEEEKKENAETKPVSEKKENEESKPVSEKKGNEESKPVSEKKVEEPLPETKNSEEKQVAETSKEENGKSKEEKAEDTVAKTPKPKKPKVMPSPGSRRSSRARKSVENFNYDDREAKKEKLDQFEVKAGKGATVGDFPGFENLLKKYTAMSTELQYVYRLMFNRTGKKDERKKHIREFSGITWATEKEETLERIKDMTEKWHSDVIKKIMDMFGIDRSSKTGGVTKGDLVERLGIWLIKPTKPKKELALSKTKSKSKTPKRKRKSKSTSSKKTSKKKTKKKKKKKVESSSEESSGEEESSEEEESESEEEPPKKKKKKKEKSKPKKKEAKVKTDEGAEEEAEEGNEEKKNDEKVKEIDEGNKKEQSEEEKNIVKSITEYIKDQDDPSSISFKALKQHVETKFGDGKAKEYRSLLKETAFKLLD